MYLNLTINLVLLNAQKTMQHLSFYSQCRQNNRNQAIDENHRSLYIHLRTLCKRIYIGETGRRLGDRFHEHLRDVERNDKDASKPVARHFNLPNHSSQHMMICGLSLHQGDTESRKNLEQKFTVSTNAFHSTNLFLFFTLPCSYQ